MKWGIVLSITESLVDFIYEIKYENIPDTVIERIKLFMADYFAACFAGYKINTGFNNANLSIIRENGGTQQASILFEERKYPADSAAYMNAVYSHGADIDDGNRNSAGHIATHIISSVFAMSEKTGAQWKDVFTAITVGYEIFNRIAAAAQPGLYEKGFHSTGIAGGLACAAACAKLMHLDREGIYNSISIAAVQSSGLIIIDESGQECKPINPGNAAKTGIISAELAKHNITAPRNPFESKKGWFNAFADGIKEDFIYRGLGTEFTIMESYLKLYPTCRHTHSCIEAGIDIGNRLRELGKYTIDDILSIDVFIYKSAIKSAGSIKKPKNAGEAKFSICYALAVALSKKAFKISDLEINAEEEISIITDKIKITEDSCMEDRACGIRGARIIVTMNDNNIFKSTVLIPKGESSNPLTWDDINAKMMDCSYGILSADKAGNIIRKIRNINPDLVFKSINGFINDEG